MSACRICRVQMLLMRCHSDPIVVLSCCCKILVRFVYHCRCDIMVDSACNVDEAEFSFHLFGHAFGETRKFFPDVFFKSCASPSSHFLYFSVGIA